MNRLSQETCRASFVETVCHHEKRTAVAAASTTNATTVRYPVKTAKQGVFCTNTENLQ